MAPNNLHTTHAPDIFNWIWDEATSEWIKQTASAGGGGGGGAATIADGADVAEGAKADAAWVSGSGSVVSLLKTIAAPAVTGTQLFANLGDAITLSTPRLSTLSLINTAGTYAGGLILKGSPDGTNYFPIPYYDFNNPTFRPEGAIPPFILFLRANIAGFKTVQVYQSNAPATSSTWVAVADSSVYAGPTGAVVIAGSTGELALVDGAGHLEVAVEGTASVQLSDGADVTQGAKADAAWTFGDGTVVSILKKAANDGATTAAYAISTSSVAGLDSGLATGIQGVSGGVPVAAKVTDGANTAAVKAASTAAAATDPALVVRAVQLPVALAANGGLKIEGVAGGVAVPISGTVTASGPLTDTQLRATPVPVSGTVTATGPLTDTQIRATPLPVSGTVTANAGTNLNTSLLALDATLTSRAQKAQVTDGTRDGTVKAASTLPLLTDTALVTTQRDPLPAGTNVLGHVIADSGSTTAVTGNVTVVQATPANLTATVTPIAITKGTQGATGFTTQDLKDAGRVRLSFYANNVASGTTTTETMITLTKSADQGATSTGSTFVVTSGKRFRITSITVGSRGHATATIQITTFALRINAAGAAIATSTPLILAGATATPAVASAWDRLSLPIPDGFEILGDGTLQFGISANAVFVTNAPTWFVNIIGYEY